MHSTLRTTHPPRLNRCNSLEAVESQPQRARAAEQVLALVSKAELAEAQTSAWGSVSLESNQARASVAAARQSRAVEQRY